MSVVGVVAAIYRYPVKSMGGERLEAAEIGPGGMVGDRQWALRDVDSGNLVAAKRPRVWGEILNFRAWYEGQTVTVEHPSVGRLEMGDRRAEEALSGLFGRRVVFEQFVEPAQGSYKSDWPDIDGMLLAGEKGIEFATNEGGSHTEGFVDSFPIHLTTTSGMATLRKEDSSLVVDDRRFRPTMVIDTGDTHGFPENSWSGREVSIGTASFAVAFPTFRCVMATAAQGDLPRQLGILKTLARINGEHINLKMGASGRGANFGVWADVATPGMVAVGQPVEIRDTPTE